MKNYFQFVVLCLIAGVAIGLFSYIQPQNKSVKSQDSVNLEQRKQELVNKHLNSTIKKMDQNQNLISNEIDRTKSSSNFNHQMPTASQKETFIRSPTAAENTFQTNQYVKPESPAEVIQMEVYRKKMQELADQAYKEEYARQFKENALKDGYEIELNDNLDVISVKPLRQPSSSQPSDYDYE